MDWEGLSDTPVMFGYEHASSQNLTFMPMIVRFHLDRIGARISLQQWQKLPLADRELLARFPAREDPELDKYFKQALLTMLGTHGDGALEPVEPGEASDAWRDTASVPAQLTEHCAQAGLPALSAAGWAALSPLQRYTLVKLTRRPKPNHDFVPAMEDFGLAKG